MNIERQLSLIPLNQLNSVAISFNLGPFFDKDKAVPQLRGAYLKGYDRLTNGAFIEEYAGYTYFSKYQLVNFTIGLDALVGFTQGRRDYLYDVMRPDNAKRIDILYGLRAGWFIPMFKRKSEDLLFE